MNKKPQDKTRNIFLSPGILFPGIFCRRKGIMIQLSFMLLLIPLILTSCTTLPQTSPNISEKNSNFKSLLLDFYSGPLNHLNGVRRGQCPMYPSCSRYCSEALEKHGFFK